jgi:hypothetical protein
MYYGCCILTSLRSCIQGASKFSGLRENMRPMGHIAHLSSSEPYLKIFPNEFAFDLTYAWGLKTQLNG